jgi:predicted amino acid racemase
LFRAVAKGDEEIVQFLLNKGANVKAQNKYDEVCTIKPNNQTITHKLPQTPSFPHLLQPTQNFIFFTVTHSFSFTRLNV